MISVNRSVLHEALKKMKTVVESAVSPTVRIVVRDGDVHLTTLGSSIRMAAYLTKIDRPGDVHRTVNYHDLTKFVASTKDLLVAIDIGETVVVQTGKARINLLHSEMFDFDVGMIPVVESHAANGLVKALKFASAAMSKERVRYNMRGVFAESVSGRTIFWGCSGPYMHRTYVAAQRVEASGTIPYDAVELLKTFGDELRLDVTATQWVAAASGITIWGPTLDAEFPNVRGVVSGLKDVATVCSLKRDEILEAVGVASAGASDGEKPMVKIDAAGGAIVFSGYERGASVKEAGSMIVNCDVAAPLKIVLDTTNLKKSVGAFAADDILIERASISNGDLIRLSAGNEEAYLMGVMS